MNCNELMSQPSPVLLWKVVCILWSVLMEMTFSYFFAYSYDGVSLICSISCIDFLITSLVFVLKSPDFHISLQRYIYKKKKRHLCAICMAKTRNIKGWWERPALSSNVTVLLGLSVQNIKRGHNMCMLVRKNYKIIIGWCQGLAQ